MIFFNMLMALSEKKYAVITNSHIPSHCSNSELDGISLKLVKTRPSLVR